MVYLYESSKKARVVVPDNHLSLAIGKEGQNARLAAKLTGWKIDIKSQSQIMELVDENGNFTDDFISEEDTEMFDEEMFDIEDNDMDEFEDEGSSESPDEGDDAESEDYEDSDESFEDESMDDSDEEELYEDDDEFDEDEDKE